MQRVKFKKADRYRLFYSFCKNRNYSLSSLADSLRVNYSTFKKYARGERLVPFSIAHKLCKLNKLRLSTLKTSIYPENWGASKGGKRGIKALFKKYPEMILEWRKLGGKSVYISNFGDRCKRKKIRKPILNKELAEFVGILLGDGTITKDFIRIFGDKRYDQDYFNYISGLIKKLFKLKTKITNQQNTLILTASSRELCDFINEKFNFPFGSKMKNKVKIPICIISDRALLKHCIRGLIDTDGCIGKSGDNLKLAFTSHNRTLMAQMNSISCQMEIFNKLYGTNLETCSVKKIKRYISIFGSSNKRHIVRYRERINNRKLLYKREVVDYYPTYKNIEIPFYGPVV